MHLILRWALFLAPASLIWLLSWFWICCIEEILSIIQPVKDISFPPPSVLSWSALTVWGWIWHWTGVRFKWCIFRLNGRTLRILQTCSLGSLLLESTETFLRWFSSIVKELGWALRTFSGMSLIAGGTKISLGEKSGARTRTRLRDRDRISKGERAFRPLLLSKWRRLRNLRLSD